MIEDANAYLSEFIQLYNKKFSVSALSDEDVHRPLDIDKEKLDETLSLHQVRKLSKNLEFSYNKTIYQIQQPGGGYRYRGKEVTISVNTEGNIKVLFGQERLSFKVLHHISRTTHTADRKTLDTLLDTKLTQKSVLLDRILHRVHKPHHPPDVYEGIWRGRGLVDNTPETGHF